MALESVNSNYGFLGLTGRGTTAAGHQGRVQQTEFTPKQIAAAKGQALAGGKNVSIAQGIDILNKPENQELLAYLNNLDTKTDNLSAFDGNAILKGQNNGEVNPTFSKEYGDYNSINIAA